MNYGFIPNILLENAVGISARITAVHKDRYALVCEHGEIYARLKTKEYYVEGEEFPTIGDFVFKLKKKRMNYSSVVQSFKMQNY